MAIIVQSSGFLDVAAFDEACASIVVHASGGRYFASLYEAEAVEAELGASHAIHAAAHLLLSSRPTRHLIDAEQFLAHVVVFFILLFNFTITTH